MSEAGAIKLDDITSKARPTLVAVDFSAKAFRDFRDCEWHGLSGGFRRLLL